MSLTEIEALRQRVAEWEEAGKNLLIRAEQAEAKLAQAEQERDDLKKTVEGLRSQTTRIMEAASPTDTVRHAAETLLGDDIALSNMAAAMHDGPLGADEYEFRADTKQGGWCLDMARAALRTLAARGGDQETLSEAFGEEW